MTTGMRNRARGMAELAVLVAGLLAICSGSASARPDQPPPGPRDPFAPTILAAHNAERARLHIAPLRWSQRLAADAQAWADGLAARNVLVHATLQERGDEGESLWWNRVGVSGPADVTPVFLAERRSFRPGVFPNISATGQWQDAGHYSQVIWPGTQELGCATARNKTYDFWVCRYWPAGNVRGVAVP